MKITGLKLVNSGFIIVTNLKNLIKVFRADLITLSVKTYTPPKESGVFVSTRYGQFRVEEKALRAKITLPHSGIIYTDEFADAVSSVVIKGKRVEIDCGPCSLKSEIISEELMKDSTLERIKNVDGQKVSARKEVKRLSKGLFGFLGKKHVVVTYEKQYETNATEQNLIENYPDSDEFAVSGDNGPGLGFITGVGEFFQLSQDEVDDVFISGWSPQNKYLNAQVVEVSGPVLDYIYEIDRALERDSIVQIKRCDFFKGAESLGIFVENSDNEGEIIINLNGQDESYFDDVFNDLVIHYLEQGKIVFVDYDIADIYQLESKIYESEIYNFFHNRTGAAISVIRKEANIPSFEEHSYIVLEPSYSQASDDTNF